MWLIVGLGNPGPKYSFTRHNMGFLTIEHLSERLEEQIVYKDRSEHKALVTKISGSVGTVFLVKPQTYMNLSGDAVNALIGFYKINLNNVLVIHDDVDQPLYQLKFQKDRGPAGHNGIKDLHEKLGSSNYARLRMGVGRPPIPQIQIADWVLSKFYPEELANIPEFLEHATDGIISFITNGFEKTMTEFNKKNEPSPKGD